MNKTATTLLVVFDVVLLTVFGVVAWQNHSVALEGRSSQEASIAQSILPPNPSSTFSSGRASSSGAFATTNLPATHGTPTVSNIRPSAAVRPVTIVPAAGWTTYADDQYAVAGTYPQAWYEYDAVGLGGSLQFTSVPQSQASTGGMIASGAAEITIYRTLETVTQAQAEDSLNSVQEANTTATVAHETVPVIAYTVASSQNSLVAYVPHGSYIYRIVLAYHGESQFSSLYSDFLATFRFTN